MRIWLTVFALTAILLAAAFPAHAQSLLQAGQGTPGDIPCYVSGNTVRDCGPPSGAGMLPLPSAQIYVGTGLGAAAAVPMSGAASISNAGLMTVFGSTASLMPDTSLALSGVTAGTYGPCVNATVGLQGIVSALSTVSCTGGAGITQLTGAVLAGPGSGSQAASLAATGVSPGTYSYPTETVNAAGQVTAISTGSGPLCKTIQFYGGAADNGTTDNLTAWNAWKAAAAVNPCLYFPAADGKYGFSASPTYSLPGGNTFASLALRGAGSDLSVLDFATGSGPVLTLNSVQQSFHIAGVTIATGAASSGNVGLTVTQAVVTNGNPADTPQSDLTDVTFRGDNGVLDTSKYWGKGIIENEVSNIKYTALNIYGGAPYQDTLPASGGEGVVLNGTATNFSVVHNFDHAYFLNLLHGIIYNQYTQGVTLTEPNVQGGYEGVYVPSSQLGIDQLTVLGGEFTTGGPAYDIQSTTTDLNVTGGLILVKDAGSIGVNMAIMQGRTLFNGVDFFGLVPPGVFTGSISGTTMTVTAVSTGSIAAGSTVGALGVTPVTVGTKVLAYGTGGTSGTGNTGTYALSASQTVSSEALQSHSGTGFVTQSGTGGGQVLNGNFSNLARSYNLAAGSLTVQGNQYQGISESICGAGNACENSYTTTIGADSGLAFVPGTRNVGAQTGGNGSKISLQNTLVPKAASYTVNADFGGTTDTAATLLANAASITFTVPTPVKNGTIYRFADSGHNYTLTTPSGIFYGCPGSGSGSLVVLANTNTAIQDDGTNYLCALSAGAGGTSAAFVGTTAGGTGSPNAYTIAVPTPAGFTLTDQYLVCFKVNVTNTGAATLAVSGTTAEPIETQTGTGLAALGGGELVFTSSGNANQYCAQYQAGAAAYVLITTPGSGVTYAASGATVTQAQWANSRPLIFTTPGQTETLLASTSLSTNGGLVIGAVGNSVAIAPNGTDQINGVNATFTCAANSLGVLTTDGAGHFAMAGCSAGAAGVVLRGTKNGLLLSNDIAAPTTSVDVSNGQAADNTNAAYLTVSSPLTVNIGSSGVNGLDTGSVAASTWYGVFLVEGGSGTGAVFSKATHWSLTGDGSAVGCSTTAGSATLTLSAGQSAGNQWTGQAISIQGAGVGGTALVTTISSGATTTSVTMASNAAATNSFVSCEGGGFNAGATNPAGPALPTGYTTAFRYIGSALTDGSSHILPFIEASTGAGVAMFRWATPVQDMNNVTVPTTTSLQAFPNIPLGVRVQPIMDLQTATLLRIRSADGAFNATGSMAGGGGYDFAITTGLILSPVWSTNASQQLGINANSAVAGTYEYTVGWLDHFNATN